MEGRQSRLGIGQRIGLVILLCALVPLIVFCTWLLYSWKQQLIQQQYVDMNEDLMRTRDQAERLAESCVLTAQTFESNTRLREHLTVLAKGERPSLTVLYDFYNNDVSGLEKIVAANADLYQVRVYSVCPEIDEMFPILFGGERLSAIGWQGEAPSRAVWLLDYTDTMFGVNTPHRAALLQPLTGQNGATVATLEVAVSLQDLLPQLVDDTIPACLRMREGAIFGQVALAGIAGDFPQREDRTPVVAQTTWEGDPVLLGSVYLPTLDAQYVQCRDLTETYGQVYRLQAMLTALMIVVGIVLGIFFRRLVRRMLGQLYLVLAGVRQFSQGEMEVTIPVNTRDEIGVFAHQINDLLVSTRQLVEKQIQNEVLVKNTEIKALQNQINAHFLYNVLESIKMMAEIDEKYEIADAVTNLARLLRYTMKWNRRTVALQEELDYIRNYIALVNLRYDGCVTVDYRVPADLQMQAVPKLSLQPLVENAVFHGGDKNSDRTIDLRAEHANGLVKISVHNTGEPMDADTLARVRRGIAGQQDLPSASGNGIGLRNVQERILMTFGEGYGVTVESGPETGTTVTVTLPEERVDREKSK